MTRSTDYSVFATASPGKETYATDRVAGVREVPYVETRGRDVHHDQRACSLCCALYCSAAVVAVILRQRRSPAAILYLRVPQSRQARKSASTE